MNPPATRPLSQRERVRVRENNRLHENMPDTQDTLPVKVPRPSGNGRIGMTIALSGQLNPRTPFRIKYAGELPRHRSYKPQRNSISE